MKNLLFAKAAPYCLLNVLKQPDWPFLFVVIFMIYCQGLLLVLCDYFGLLCVKTHSASNWTILSFKFKWIIHSILVVCHCLNTQELFRIAFILIIQWFISKILNCLSCNCCQRSPVKWVIICTYIRSCCQSLYYIYHNFVKICKFQSIESHNVLFCVNSVNVISEKNETYI